MSSEISKVKKVKMSDGCNIMAAIISSEDELTLHLPNFISGARRGLISRGMFVGLDTEWMFRTETFPYCPNRSKIALLKLCNNFGFCLLIELHRFERMPRALVELLSVRDIRFVGVNISKELEKLKEDYGLEIKSTVELNSVAAVKFAKNSFYKLPWSISLGGLEVLWKSLLGTKQPTVVDEEQMFWLVDNPWDKFDIEITDKQLEYAVFSAYAAVKIAEKLYTEWNHASPIL